MPDTNLAMHGPYEDLAIELVRLFENLIDGQTTEQKAFLWGQWINFWAPLMSVIAKKSGA